LIDTATNTHISSSFFSTAPSNPKPQFTDEDIRLGKHFQSDAAAASAAAAGEMKRSPSMRSNVDTKKMDLPPNKTSSSSSSSSSSSPAARPQRIDDDLRDSLDDEDDGPRAAPTEPDMDPHLVDKVYIGVHNVTCKAELHTK
jgi:hypothetical protein